MVDPSKPSIVSKVFNLGEQLRQRYRNNPPKDEYGYQEERDDGASIIFLTHKSKIAPEDFAWIWVN